MDVEKGFIDEDSRCATVYGNAIRHALNHGPVELLTLQKGLLRSCVACFQGLEFPEAPIDCVWLVIKLLRSSILAHRWLTFRY